VNEALEANEVLDCWDVVMILINGEEQWEVICGHNKTICGKVTVTIIDAAMIVTVTLPFAEESQSQSLILHLAILPFELNFLGLPLSI